MANETTNIRVEKEALQALRDAIYSREGRLRGFLGKAASEALKEKAENIIELEKGSDE